MNAMTKGRSDKASKALDSSTLLSLGMSVSQSAELFGIIQPTAAVVRKFTPTFLEDVFKDFPDRFERKMLREVRQERQGSQYHR